LKLILGQLYSGKGYLIVILFIASISLSIFFKYMYVLHPEVAFMDTLRFLTYFDDSERGTASLFSTWIQGEHRSYLAQFFVYMNAKILKFDVFGATLSSGIIIALTGILLGIEQYRTLSDKSRRRLSLPVFFGLVAITFFTLFSLANWELYSVDVGVTLFGKNLVFILYWIGLERALLETPKQLILRIVLLLSGPTIVLVLSSGWSYAFVFTTIICGFVVSPVNKEAKKFRGYLFVVLLMSQIIYVVAGYYLGAGSYSSLGRSASVLNVVIGFFFALSSGFMGVETITSLGMPVWVQLVAPMVLIITVAWLTIMVVVSKFRIPLVAIALVIYSVLHIAAVAYARGRYDPLLAMAPRYYMDISLFFIGFFWIAMLFIREGHIIKIKKFIFISVLFILALLFLVGQGITCKDEWLKAPYRHQAFNKMRYITLKGVTSIDDARFLQAPNIEVAARGVNIQRSYGLGPFRGIECSAPLNLSGLFGDDEWIGSNTNLLIKNCGGNLHLKVFLPYTFSTKLVGVSVDGDDFNYTKIEPGKVTDINLSLSGNNKKYLDIIIVVDQTTNPSDIQSGSTDRRKLGVIVSSITTEKR
jgi:hypothetical protein